MAGPVLAEGAEAPKGAIRLEEGTTPHGWKTSGTPDGQTWMTTGKWSNFRLHLAGEAIPGAKAVLSFGDVGKMDFQVGATGKVELDAAFEGLPGKPRVVRLWQDGGAATYKEFPAPQDAAGEEAQEVEIRLNVTGDFRTATAWIQSLDRGDHAEIIREWGPESLQRGEKIYAALCSVCHGTLTQAGSLPTALRFGEAPFKNGSDPHSLWLTLTHGYGQMTPMPQYSTRDKYAVIHYIRETYLRAASGDGLVSPGPEYLASLPRGFVTQEEVPDIQTLPEWLRMDFGPVLNYTYEVAPDNIAYKGIAVRVDEGAGGVSKGRSWMVYEHDTMRMAAAWSGPDFIDWRSIAFDGSHQTHPKIVGTPLIINPPGPDWAHPELHHWDDPRLRGRDAKPYGPLPREWMQFRGQYVHNGRVVLRYSVGKTAMLESPGLLKNAPVDVFTRTLNVEPSLETHHLRVAPVDAAGVSITLAGGDASTSLGVRDGFTVLTLRPSEEPRQLRIYLGRLAMADLEAQVRKDTHSLDLHSLTLGGAPQFPELPETVLPPAGDNGAPFEIQNLTLPVENPWGSWMRPTGFDFLPDGESVAVCTWNGDVFRVHGIGHADGVLTWQRIASGLV